MTRQERFIRRNNHVRNLFYELQKKNPKWRIECIIEEVAIKTFLSCRTVEAIISYEGIYKEDTDKNKTQISLF